MMRLLDLYCGQGGAAQGYIDAGWEVTGVDLADHSSRYPGTFIRGDALRALLTLGSRFDAVHASPPCQAYSIATAGNAAARSKHTRLIAATRELLEQTGLPYVIENVEQAASEMVNPTMLCGRMFGLKADDADGQPLVLDRHRLFETNWLLTAPPHPAHGDEQVAGVYGGGRRAKVPRGTPHHVSAPLDRHEARHVRKGGYVPRSKRVKQELLGIDWMTVKGMEESIPPVYAEHVGRQLLREVS